MPIRPIVPSDYTEWAGICYIEIYTFFCLFFLFFSFFALLLGFLISKIFQIQNRNMTSESRCWEISSPFSPEVMGFEGLNAKFSAFFPPVCIVVSAFIQGMSLGRSPLVNFTNYSFKITRQFCLFLPRLFLIRVPLASI